MSLDKVEAFRALHVAGAPLVLWNVWDAGSAKAVAEAGAQAIATGSWSVAAAQGFEDGQDLPMADALRVAGQVARAVDLPVSVDFEGGYDVTPEGVAGNVAQLLETGAIGLNLEDRVVGGTGLHGVQDQVGKIAAIRAVSDLPFFINARTDVFFQGSKDAPEDLLQEVLRRAEAYAAAGADGLFVPGLADLDVISTLCAASPLPVNIMRMGSQVEIAALAQAGVGRISHGPGPYISAMKALGAAAVV